MRYGIFSDVHSNIEALEAVTRAYQRESIDQYLCVGDVVGYGADPEECIKQVNAIARVTVAGNHDWASVNLFSAEYFNAEAAQAVSWTIGRLKGEERRFLSSLRLVFKDQYLTLVHGTLDEPHAFRYMMDESSARKTFAILDTDICFIGHSHVAGLFVKDKNGRLSYSRDPVVILKEFKQYIVNVGSVGQPRDANSFAAYCIYDTEERRIEIKRVAYNAEAAREKIIAAGLPKFLGDRLLIGR